MKSLLGRLPILLFSHGQSSGRGSCHLWKIPLAIDADAEYQWLLRYVRNGSLSLLQFEERRGGFVGRRAGLDGRQTCFSLLPNASPRLVVICGRCIHGGRIAPATCLPQTNTIPRLAHSRSVAQESGCLRSSFGRCAEIVFCHRAVLLLGC